METQIALRDLNDLGFVVAVPMIVSIGFSVIALIVYITIAVVGLRGRCG
jgi:hypothetical protein